jgi:hypothetical protein
VKTFSAPEMPDLGGGAPGTEGEGGTGNPVRDKALKDAKKAADDAIDKLLNPDGKDGLGPDGLPLTSGGPDSLDPAARAARDKAFDDAKKKVDDALDPLIKQAEKDAANGDPAAKARADALKQAKAAADKAIEDAKNSDKIPTTSDDPATQRLEALKEAEAAADKAIDDLKGDTNDPNDPHDKALQDAKDAVDKELDKLEKDAEKDVPGGDGTDNPLTEHQQEVHDQALADAKEAADKAIEDLMDDPLDPNDPDGSDDPGGDGKDWTDADEANRDKGLGDAKDSADKAIDKLIEDTKNSDASAEDKQTRIDALNEAKGAVDDKLDNLVEEEGPPKEALKPTSLTEFLTPRRTTELAPVGAGTGGPGGGIDVSGETRTVPQSNDLQLSDAVGPTRAGNAQAASMLTVPGGAGFDPSGQGMPMTPPMGMGAGGGQPAGDRQRNTWLSAEEGAWGEEEQSAPAAAVGRNPE